jgi:hypothetical protein
MKSKNSYLNFNLMSGWDKLLELGRSLLESRCGDISHEDVGSFFGEEDACFESDTADGV